MTSDAAADFVQALALHKAGRLAEAEAIYKRVLAAKPDHFDSLHLLGVILLQRGDAAGAVRLIEAALTVNPNHILAWNNRGNALQALRRFDDALASYESALTLKSDYAEAWVNRGVTLHALKRFDDASISYDRALALRPDFPEALSNRGNALKELKRHDDALASFDRALALRPDYAEAHYNRGNTLHALERYGEALTSQDRALVLRPDYAGALANRGASLHELKRFQEALENYNRALALRPEDAEALSNRGATLHALNRFDEAMDDYDRALALAPNDDDALTNRGATLNTLKRFDESLVDHDRALVVAPDNAEALSNRGLTLTDLNRFDESLASYDRAIALRPNFADAYVNRGVTLHSVRRFDEALQSYARALSIDPNHGDAHFNEALCRLLIGDPRGWDEHEWRWNSDQLRNEKRNFAQPQWARDTDIAGKTVLLHAEQGFGDTIQFCRYAPLVAARGARVILEAQKPLFRLLRSLAGATQIVARGEPLPDFDLHCPLLSLPFVLETGFAAIPAQTPYLAAPLDSVTKWQSRLPARARPRVGLAWSGNPRHKNDHNRSIALAALLPLLTGDATYISLQRDVAAADEEVLRSRPDILHFGAEIKDFSDTAALTTNLDLVISVDTAPAHLAGALGKPVWLLIPYIPDWRWLLDRADSPWYPTMRLFRQDETRTWDGVIPRVQTALGEFVQEAKAGA